MHSSKICRENAGDLSALPRDLLLALSNYLDPKSSVSLAGTCQYLRNIYSINGILDASMCRLNYNHYLRNFDQNFRRLSVFLDHEDIDSYRRLVRSYFTENSQYDLESAYFNYRRNNPNEYTLCTRYLIKKIFISRLPRNHPFFSNHAETHDSKTDYYLYQAKKWRIAYRNSLKVTTWSAIGVLFAVCWYSPILLTQFLCVLSLLAGIIALTSRLIANHFKAASESAMLASVSEDLPSLRN